MTVWKVTRQNPSLGQHPYLGTYTSKKKAFDCVLVAIQNDFSYNQPWPEFQKFADISVSVLSLIRGLFEFVAVSDSGAYGERKYYISSVRVD